MPLVLLPSEKILHWFVPSNVFPAKGWCHSRTCVKETGNAIHRVAKHRVSEQTTFSWKKKWARIPLFQLNWPLGTIRYYSHEEFGWKDLIFFASRAKSSRYTFKIS